MRVACFGDCHIGSYGKKLDEGTGLNARLLDTVQSLTWVIADANERGVDDILCAGDVFRNSRPTPTELVMASNALRASAAPIVMIPGNHDLPRGVREHSAVEPIGRDGNVISTPWLFSRQGYDLATLPYPNRAQLAASLPGYADLSPDEADAVISDHLSTILRGFAAQMDPDRPTILLGHISIDAAEAGAERGIMAGRDITIPLTAIPEEFSFAVFGHIHKAQDFGHLGRPNVLYTGSTERIDFGEEEEEKSYVILDLEAGTWERVPIPCREYRTIHVHYHPDGHYSADEDWPGDISGPSPTRDRIVRVAIDRPENVRPHYEMLAGQVSEDAFDFRGFVEDVRRSAAVRSQEIVQAQSLEELLGVWHEAKDCPVPLEDLVAAGSEMERSVAT